MKLFNFSKQITCYILLSITLVQCNSNDKESIENTTASSTLNADENEHTNPIVIRFFITNESAKNNLFALIWVRNTNAGAKTNRKPNIKVKTPAKSKKRDNSFKKNSNNSYLE